MFHLPSPALFIGRRVPATFAWALALFSTFPLQAQDAGFGPPGTSVVLRHQGRCLEVAETLLPVDGARVQLARCEGQPNQAWRFERGRLVHVATGRCLDVYGPDSGLDGARVQVVTCNTAPNQQWRHERGQIVVRVDERCLEAPAADLARPWAGVQTWACDGERPQRWRVNALPQGPVATLPPLGPVLRTIEAGPIFGNADAAQKCPTVCAPGRWNGQWVTTVQGRMSVCQCAFEGAPLPPAGPGLAMAPDRFDELVRAIDDEPFATNGLRTLQMAARDHRFSVEQALRLLEAFDFGTDRLRALEVATPRLVDRADAFRLLGAFTFESERAQARQILERNR